MRVHRKAAALVLLGFSLGTSGGFAAKARVEGPPRPAEASTWSALGPLWHRFTHSLLKAGCTIAPLGRCEPEPATQAQSDSGCGIDPLGHCSTGH